MVPNEFWKQIMRGGVSLAVESSRLLLSEFDSLIKSIDTPIDLREMNLNTQRRTGGLVMGNRILEDN